MTVRDDLFVKFGPKLTEALLEMWIDELNEIRISLGKPPRTKEYVLGRCHNNLNHLDNYDWMNES